LFAIIFVWTPVHFWALALMLKDDYAAAGIPMLPVVKGDRTTVNQIGMYTVITVVVTMMPFLMPGVGVIYLVAAGLLNVLLVMKAIGLWKQIDRPHASSLFHYSMLYLALLFLALAIDRSVPASDIHRKLTAEVTSASSASRLEDSVSSLPSELRHEGQMPVISVRSVQSHPIGGIGVAEALSPIARSRALEQL
jgi:hypothetical protein